MPDHEEKNLHSSLQNILMRPNEGERMADRSKVIAKLSTLDAAQRIFFIVAALGIRQSLVFLGHDNSSNSSNDTIVKFSNLELVVIGFGYLTTALRFSHGVSLLYGHEKERVDNSTLPSSSRVFLLAIFMVTLAILLYLMAASMLDFRTYLIFTLIMLVVDFVYILLSGVVRGVPYRLLTFWIVWKETQSAYPARAALQWIVSDIVLMAITGVLLFFFPENLSKAVSWSLSQSESVLFWPPYENEGFLTWPQYQHLSTGFAGILILFSLVDYVLNQDFYFGGKTTRRKQKFIFVCSPLRGEGKVEEMGRNILRAQWYCKTLMEKRTIFKRKEKFVPFASHAFFTYFLDDKVPEDRILGSRAALAFLAACDAIYVYVPSVENVGLMKRFRKERLCRETLSSGMKIEIEEAQKLGLDIRYNKAQVPPEERHWQPPWSSLDYQPSEKEKEKRKEDQIYFDVPVKRVYVCTPFRGKNFNKNNPNLELMKSNTRMTLWCCHELVRDSKNPVAPFAPQAFYPYFWQFFTVEGRFEEKKWDSWFGKSLEVMKICDAVYVYTADGLPDKSAMSEGMITVIDLAHSLGIEIQYRKIPQVSEGWKPTLPNFLFENESKPPQQNAA